MIILTILGLLILAAFLCGVAVFGWALLKTSKILFGLVCGFVLVPVLLILAIII